MNCNSFRVCLVGVKIRGMENRGKIFPPGPPFFILPIGVFKGRSGWVYAQPTTDSLTSGGRMNDSSPTIDDLGSSRIGLWWMMVGLGTKVSHKIFAALKLKTTTQTQFLEKITRSKQKLKQKAPYQTQI